MLGRTSKTPPDEAKSGGLATLLRRRDSTHERTWMTPWGWVDAGRLYHGDDSFWLYRELPERLLYGKAEGLRSMLTELARHLDGRPIHLLQHAWSAPASLPEGTPPALAELLVELRDLHVPLRSLIIGIQITAPADPESGWIRSLAGGLRQSLDDALGESVPDFSTADSDRGVVEQLLTVHGARDLSTSMAAHLESWYLLGANQDPIVVEEESSIDFGGVSSLVCLALSDIVDTGPAGILPAPGANGATCLSVRGTLSSGVLRDTSIVVARRSSASSSWHDNVKGALTAGSTQHLPLRQLPALSETLPCSVERMTPPGSDLPFTSLSKAGLADPTLCGDRFGLSIGMVGADYSDLGWWNPTSKAGNVLAIAGGAGGGKTVLAEYLALQALSVGFDVRYLSQDGEAGRPLVTLARDQVTAITKPLPGLANPGRFTHSSALHALNSQLLHGLLPAVSSNAWQAMLGVPDPQDYELTISFDQVAQFAHDKTIAARIIKAQREDTGIALFLAAAPYPQGSIAVPVARITRHVPPRDQDHAADLLVATALRSPSSRPVLVVTDGVNVGAATVLALRQARATGAPVSMVHVNRTMDAARQLEPALRIAAAQREPHAASELLTWVGLDPTPARLAWLRDAGPRTLDRRVSGAPTMLLADDTGRQCPLMVAPLPESLLDHLTRGAADKYRN